mmetsp:Transcript_20540/g.57760  ORF Transcript_20540/g.57760 Transcript_20540/m.57760 type:complete len:116 (-) Transcript_20540:1167-1514(-)
MSTTGTNAFRSVLSDRRMASFARGLRPNITMLARSHRQWSSLACFPVGRSTRPTKLGLIGNDERTVTSANVSEGSLAYPWYQTMSYFGLSPQQAYQNGSPLNALQEPMASHASST